MHTHEHAAHTHTMCMYVMYVCDIIDEYINDQFINDIN